MSLIEEQLTDYINHFQYTVKCVVRSSCFLLSWSYF